MAQVETSSTEHNIVEWNQSHEKKALTQCWNEIRNEKLKQMKNTFRMRDQTTNFKLHASNKQLN